MTYSVFRKNLLGLLIVSASLPASSAETQNSSGDIPILLNQVTVSATRSERQLDDVSSSVVVLSAEDSEQRMARNIRDLVKYNPGVTVSNDSRFGLGGFNIRGMEKNRVKITVDGVNQPKTFGYDRNLQSQRNMFDIENMKQLEILKGPASSIYGSDAIGGVAAFVTKDPADFLAPAGDDSYFSLKAGYSSADTSHSETVTAARRIGDFESLVVYTRRDGKETKSFGGRGGLGAARERANPQDTQSDSLLAKLQNQLNDTNRIGWTFEWLDAKSKTDLLAEEGRTVQNGPHSRIYRKERANDRATRHRIGFFHEWDADVAAFDNMKWSLSWQKSESRQKTDDHFVGVLTGIPPNLCVATGLTPDCVTNDDTRFKDYRYTEESVSLESVFNKSLDALGLNHYLTYGFNLDNKTYSNKNTALIIDNRNPNSQTAESGDWMPEIARRQYGLFVQDEIAFLDGRLMVTPALRYDRFDEKIKSVNNYQGNASQFQDETLESLTGRLGAVYEFNDLWSVYGQFSQGFTTPDVFARFFTYGEGKPVEILANPDIKPEESNSFEIGLRATTNAASMEITAFYNRYKNFIEENCIDNLGCTSTSGTFQYQNLSKATIRGIEFKSTLLLDELFGAPAGTHLNTSIAYAKGRGEKSGDNGAILEDEPLNSIAPFTAIVGLGYDAPTGVWGGATTLTLVAAKNKNDISKRSDVSTDGYLGKDKFAPSGYGIVDLTAYYKPIDSVTINAGVFNITDKKYFIWDDVRTITAEDVGINRYTQPGRHYAASVKWEF